MFSCFATLAIRISSNALKKGSWYCALNAVILLALSSCQSQLILIHSVSSSWVTVITPGFHSLFLEAMVKIFTNCSERTISKFDRFIKREGHAEKSIELDLEAEFSSLALDIIGLGVFNYDFGSVTKESPVIKVWNVIFFYYYSSWSVHNSCLFLVGTYLKTFTNINQIDKEFVPWKFFHNNMKVSLIEDYSPHVVE